MKNAFPLADIPHILHHLNYRWNLEALALWKGDPPPFPPYRIYEGFAPFLRLETLARIEGLEKGRVRTRLRHALMDHYLQRALLPHETEMRTWMRGAAAHVAGEKIYFRDMISWCRKPRSHEDRQCLQKETGPLLKFLKPFALNYWKILLEVLRNDFGFETYAAYCRDKKGIPLSRYYEMIEGLLEETDALYFPAMEEWAARRFRRPLEDLTRFDAIHLLGLVEFDHLYPETGTASLFPFFRRWGIDLDAVPGLSLELERRKGKSAQGMCFVLEAPEEVYVVVRPEGGWVDLETLCHELGHGLSAAFTSPSLPVVDRDLATTFSLSESFAFLLQNMAMSRPFLVDQIGLSLRDAEILHYHKVLRDFSVFRRYAAKFLAEYGMFSGGDLADGGPYATRMRRHTGFYYQPEGHLFDLAPEFYCLDYVLGWMGAAVMEERLGSVLGERWMFRPEAGRILGEWWSSGNRYDIFEFMTHSGLGRLDPAPLLRQWAPALGAGRPRPRPQ